MGGGIEQSDTGDGNEQNEQGGERARRRWAALEWIDHTEEGGAPVGFVELGGGVQLLTVFVAATGEWIAMLAYFGPLAWDPYTAGSRAKN